MALIDILKLNEELDKMIAAQEVEIGKLNEETETSFASQYAEMYADLKTLNDFSRDLNTHIYHIYAGTMPPKASGRCYWDTLYYHFGRRDIEVQLYHINEYDPRIGDFCAKELKYWDYEKHCPIARTEQNWINCCAKMLADYLETHCCGVDEIITVDM